MAEPKRDFRIDKSPDELEVMYKDRISALAGIPGEDIKPSDFKTYFSDAVANRWNLFASFRWARVQRKYYHHSVNKSEIINLDNAIAGLIDEPGFVTYGSHSPFYLSALNRYKQNHPSTTTHRALLAGAFTSQSMMEFSATVGAVFPDNSTLTVDLAPTNKPEFSSQRCSFVVGDVRQLPLGAKFDTIHTSGLLDFLGSATRRQSENPELSTSRLKFFAEARQALKPGGLLIMAERCSYPNRDIAEQPYIDELKQTKFNRIEIGDIDRFRSRRELDLFMMGTSTDIYIDQLRVSGLIGIIATA